MEEWVLWFSMAAAVAIALIGLSLYRKFATGSKGTTNQGAEGQGQGGRVAHAGAAARRPGGRAAATARNRRLARRANDSDSDDGAPVPGPAPQRGAPARAQPEGSDDEEAEIKFPGDTKLGAKKRAKLEAKEEKRQQREVEDRLREERKAKEAKEEEERKKQAEQEEEEERKQREEAIRLKQEQLQREQEEYLAMKSAFTVEEEGCDVHDTEEEVNLLEKFVQYVKEKKVILFEELATHFGLKVPAAIDRLNTLVAEGRLTGVMDDRGKFIYISEEELLKFAKFIKQRGRVSISDLVDNSSNIINLSQDLRSASAEA